MPNMFISIVYRQWTMKPDGVIRSVPANSVKDLLRHEGNGNKSLDVLLPGLDYVKKLNGVRDIALSAKKNYNRNTYREKRNPRLSHQEKIVTS